MDNHDFCRALLRTTRQDLTAEQKRHLKGAWSYFYNGEDQGEYHVPADDFYWFGSAHCAYDARQQGINAWLAAHYEENEDAPYYTKRKDATK